MRSNMFNGDLLKISGPVNVEFELIWPFAVVFWHNSSQTLLEPFLKLQVEFIASFDDGLVVRGILDGHFCVDLVLRDSRHVKSHRACFWRFISRVSSITVLWKINFENTGSKSRELSSIASTQVFITLLCNQVLDILVFLLDDLVARQ